MKDKKKLISTTFAISLATNTVTTRRATLADAQGIADLVNLGEREGQLLPRTIESIQSSIDDWIVAEDNKHIIGIGSLIEMGPTLSEIRSLAVAPDYRKNGVGAQIVNAIIDLARERSIPNVFALTRAVLFFEKQGFIISEKENFPEKVWRDCNICRVQFMCDKVAVVKSVDSLQ
jgi:amino-acid N-acetyltransferase